MVVKRFGRRLVVSLTKGLKSTLNQSYELEMKKYILDKAKHDLNEDKFLLDCQKFDFKKDRFDFKKELQKKRKEYQIVEAAVMMASLYAPYGFVNHLTTREFASSFLIHYREVLMDF